MSAKIESVKFEGGRVCATLANGAVLKVTLDAATQLATELAEAPSGGVSVEVGAIIAIELSAEDRATLAGRIGRLGAHLDGFSE